MGHDWAGQCRIPAFEAGVINTKVSTGSGHTVFLDSSGRAISVGRGLV